MTGTSPPHGLSVSQLPEQPGAEHAATRTFCLDTIREFYGVKYRPDWHDDLDSLLQPREANHYATYHRGGFWVLRNAEGIIIGTAGVRGLKWKPALIEAFYDQADAIASLWRVYVRRDLRGCGIGRWLNALAEREAARMRYTTMYLHASADARATIVFWRSAGYRQIADTGADLHFDKELSAAPPVPHNGRGE
jgi:GNAT superfamily N-acetyltransferase